MSKPVPAVRGALLVFVGAALCSSARADIFQLTYTFGGDTLTAMIGGTLQADHNTVIVSGVTDPMFNGAPGAPIVLVDSFSDYLVASGVPPTLSLDGSVMDFLACSAPVCWDGFLFYNEGAGGGFGAGSAFSSGVTYGAANLPFDPAAWSLVDIATAPEPSSIVLFGAVLGSLAIGRRRVPFNASSRKSRS